MTTSTPTTDLIRTSVFGMVGLAVLIAGFSAFTSNGGTTDGRAVADAPEFDFAAMTDAQQDAFGEAVRAYLLGNPQVIMEAVAVLEERDRADAAEADKNLLRTHAEAIFNDGFSHVSGNPDGDVTIVEFIDYRCGYCRRAHGDVAELLSGDGNIRLITKEFPILGPNSLASSEFAVAVKQIAGAEAYEAANDMLIGLNAEMNEPALRRLAETLGVDADAVLEAMKSGAVQEELLQTRALAQALNINGTPTFVVGTGETMEMLRGYLPLEGMQNVVAGVREAAAG